MPAKYNQTHPCTYEFFCRIQRATLHQLKGTLARSEGAPYLAAFNGCRLDV
jgi:hypothetical protein